MSVVLFDLDDTLFAHREAVTAGIVAHTRTLNGEGMAGEAGSDIARWRALEEEHYHRYLAGELDFFGQRRARVRGFVEPYGVSLADDPAADAWYDGYSAEYQRAWTLHGDTLPCLDALVTVRLGLVTNGELSFQTHKIEAMGIADRFEHIVASGSLGFAKPDPRIFDYACERFGVSVENAAYVGDRLQTDALGAASAGLTGVWLDRDGAASADELGAAAASGVHVIATLAQLPALVASL
ncbi:MAG TPA: HAD family hydrolase [Galbitalea sp.]